MYLLQIRYTTSHPHTTILRTPHKTGHIRKTNAEKNKIYENLQKLQDFQTSTLKTTVDLLKITNIALTKRWKIPIKNFPHQHLCFVDIKK